MNINQPELSNDLNSKKLWVSPEVHVLPIEQTNQLPPPQQPEPS